MALSATMYHFKIALSDVDRGVYEALDLRVARHPSETARYLLTRVIAYALCFEEGIAFTKGLSTAEEPALWVKDLQGNLRVWIEVGSPSAERLHKVSKGSPRVVVFTQHEPAQLVKTYRGETIHKVDDIELFALPAAFLDSLDTLTDRNAKWDFVRSGGEIYITSGGETVSTPVNRFPLREAAT